MPLIKKSFKSSTVWYRFKYPKNGYNSEVFLCNGMSIQKVYPINKSLSKLTPRQWSKFWKDLLKFLNEHLKDSHIPVKDVRLTINRDPRISVDPNSIKITLSFNKWYESDPRWASNEEMLEVVIKHLNSVVKVFKRKTIQEYNIPCRYYNPQRNYKKNL